MKRIIGLLVIFIVFMTIDVYANDYSTLQLIPVDTTASVNTETFYYQDMVFSSSVNEKGNGIIRFGGIKNHLNKTVPVSINLLLFDQDKKNIGFLTYCSTKDIESDYAKYEIKSLQSVGFAINVTTRYYVRDKGVLDTKYVAVFDENKYCHIGGYSKYEGLTLKEIIDLINKKEKTSASKLNEIIVYLSNSFWAKVFVWVVIGLIILSITGNVINQLYYKLYRTNTNLAYIPILNYYICMKLSFGSIISLGYLIVSLISILFLIIKVPFLMIIVNVIGIISFMIVILKLITKKYELFFFEPNVKSKGNFFNKEEIESSNSSLKEDIEIDKKQELKELKKKEKEAKRLAKLEEKERKRQEKLARKNKGEVIEDKDKSDELFAQSLIDTDNKVVDNNLDKEKDLISSSLINNNQTNSNQEIREPLINNDDNQVINPLAELDLNYNNDNDNKDDFDINLDLDDDKDDE